MRKLLLAAAMTWSAVVICCELKADTLFGVDTNNNIVIFDSNTPQTIANGGAVTGLSANENIVGLDYRANGGGVFAVTNLNNIFTINVQNFAATQVGATLATPLTGNSFAFDFNPAAAGSAGNGTLARIISDTDNNRVIDSVTGGYFGSIEKTAVFYAASDANFGVNPNIQGIAYDGNTLGSTATQQFGIDASLGILTTVANNAGTLGTIGSLGSVAIGPGLTDEVAFDISGSSGIAFASLQNIGGFSQLYTIDLSSGEASLQGLIGNGGTLRDFTVIPSAIPEPSAVVVLGLAMAGLYGQRRRRRESPEPGNRT